MNPGNVTTDQCEFAESIHSLLPALDPTCSRASASADMYCNSNLDEVTSS